MLSSPVTDLARRAETDASRILFVDGDVRLTFTDVHTAVRRVAAALAGKGVRRGDRVAVLMARSYRQAIAQLGAMAAGGVLVPVSDLLKPDQVQHILRDSGAEAAIVDSDKVDRLGPAAGGMQVIAAGGEEQALETILDVGPTDFSEGSPALIGHDNAAIIYTSGSTGFPKGIVLSHRNLWDGARIVSAYLGHGPEDRLAQILSLNFDYGLNQVFGAIHVGAELHFSTFHFPRDVFEFLRAHEITTLALMPIFLNRLFDHHFYKPEFAAGIDSLKRITTSGGRMPKATIDAIRQGLPDTDLYLMYGLSEAFRSTYLPPAQVDIRPTSIGRAIPDAEILVLDETGEACGPNTPGELVHRGGVIAKGYWNAPELTAARFRPWTDASGNTEIAVWSGDIVRRDEEGYLYFIGRKDNMIKTSGHRVSPEEVESVAEQHDAIRYAVAFGRQHDVLGEEIVLACILADDVTAPETPELKRFLAERMAAYMVPHRLVFQNAFDVTPGNQGKIDRTLARERAIETLDAEAGAQAAE